MASESSDKLRDRLDKCVKKVRASKAQVEPVVKQISEGTMEADYLDKIVLFLNDFDEVKETLDTLSLGEGGLTAKMSKEDTKAVKEIMPLLISEVETLAKYQVILLETLKKGVESNSESMKKIRNAKNMFEKFVKKPRQGAKFFDQEG